MSEDGSRLIADGVVSSRVMSWEVSDSFRLHLAGFLAEKVDGLADSDFMDEIMEALRSLKMDVAKFIRATDDEPEYEGSVKFPVRDGEILRMRIVPNPGSGPRVTSSFDEDMGFIGRVSSAQKP